MYQGFNKVTYYYHRDTNTISRGPSPNYKPINNELYETIIEEALELGIDTSSITFDNGAIDLINGQITTRDNGTLQIKTDTADIMFFANCIISTTYKPLRIVVIQYPDYTSLKDLL